MKRGRPTNSRGASLIEVMIALVILAFGLLGMIGLKVASLRATAQSNARAVASVHASEMFDRLRANPMRARAGQYAIALTEPAPAAGTSIAMTDLLLWRRSIAQNLPGGVGSVAVQPDGSALVVIQWTEREDRTAVPRVLSFAFEGRL